VAFDPVFFLLGLSVNGMIASGDFTNIATNNAADGVYTLDGVPCTIGDIIDLEDPANQFDPLTDIDAGGIKPSHDGGGYHTRILRVQPSLVASLVSGGFTLVLKGYTGTSFSLGIVPANSDSSIYSQVQVTTSSTQLNATDLAQSNFPNDFTDDQAVVLAMTFTEDRLSLSVNGGDTESFPHPAIDPAMVLIEMSFQSGTGDGRFRSFAFYEVIADAELPLLSAL